MPRPAPTSSKADQEHVLALAKALRPGDRSRILRGGFGFYGPDARGRRRIHAEPVVPGAGRQGHRAARPRLQARRGRAGTVRSPPRSAGDRVASWLEEVGAPATVKAGMRGLRGFFLADPEDLSMLPLVEQFADVGAPGRSAFFRIKGGNDRLATGIVARLRGARAPQHGRPQVVQHDNRVTVTIEALGKPHTEITADYFVCALPASTARGVIFEPALPEPQHDAIAHLRYGCATRLLLQFDTRFWRKRGRPSAFGTDLDDRRDLGRQRAAEGPAGDPELPRRRARVARPAGHRARGRRARRDRADRLARRAVAPARVADDRVGPRSAGRAAATRISIPASTRCGAPGSRARPAGSSSPASTRASSTRAT